jgi:gamma-glutamylcysteine synthetase
MALARAGMDEAALQTWLRNDVRIAGYIERRFASTPGIDRAAAIAAWVSLLRDRAGLR